ncbi:MULTISPECIES: hypothetical protein [unclassified Moorena]|uniref:hypothetical protein n=1 Tax=unclassified Moorena TaxID=2683338 RepID=UPI0013C7C061|nr:MULTISPECIES: hypothetical protein [unclassified Moorena]NEO19974.1 hypothetical protein [Moorena sp. SIO4A5]NEP25486.1 hypothetical protein [Moorena sp. SIO3I6]NEQ59451.1 hypothetical protein [Moorena sp. SIO4A1]
MRGLGVGSCSLFPTPYSLLPTPYSLLPTPYSLLPTPYCRAPPREGYLTQLRIPIKY